jgi:hypothetical protein
MVPTVADKGTHLEQIDGATRPWASCETMEWVRNLSARDSIGSSDCQTVP